MAVSPLNALMEKLPGVAMQLYQNTIQQQQREEDRIFELKQSALQRAFQSKEAALNRGSQEERDKAADNYRMETLKAQKEEAIANAEYRKSMLKGQEDEKNRSFQRWQITEANTVKARSDELAYKYANLTNEEKQFDTTIKFQLEELENRKFEFSEKFAQNKEQFAQTMEQRDLEYWNNYNFEKSKYDDMGAFRNAQLQKIEGEVEIQDYSLDALEIPGQLRGAKLPENNLDTENLISKDNTFYGDSPSFLGQAWDATKDMVNAFTASPLTGGGLFGKDIDINMSPLTDLLGKKQETISQWIKDANIPDTQYKNAYVEASKKFDSQVGAKVGGLLRKAKQTYGEKVASSLMDELLKEQDFMNTWDGKYPKNLQDMLNQLDPQNTK